MVNFILYTFYHNKKSLQYNKTKVKMKVQALVVLQRRVLNCMGMNEEKQIVLQKSSQKIPTICNNMDEDEL